MANRRGKSGSSERLYFLGLPNHCDSDCSHEIKRHLLLGRKTMTNLDSILKSRDITLPTKVYIVKALVFPVVMYGCESWIIKKAEHQRTAAFELRCWRRLLRDPWTARRSNQSILKELYPEYWLEGLTLKLKFQYCGHLIWTGNSSEKDPDAGKDWRQKEKGAAEDKMVRQHHWLNEDEFEQTLGDSERQRSLACAVHGVAKSWTWFSNWTTIITTNPSNSFLIYEKT